MLVHPRLDVFRRGFGVVEQLAQAVGRGLELVGVGGRMLNMGGQSLMMLPWACGTGASCSWRRPAKP